MERWWTMIRKTILSPVIWILALAALLYVPPPTSAPAQFASQATWGGTAGGTANAITVTVANYTQNVGVTIQFVAAAPNTAQTTLNITSTGVTALKRMTSVGIQELVGGEINTGDVVTVVFDGSIYKLKERRDVVGQSIDVRTTSAPAGYALEDGSCVSRTATATVALFAAIGTTYGVCDGTTTFALPDSRGRASVPPDNQGSNGSAGRVTNAGSGCTWTAVGTGCGAQNRTLGVNDIPVLSGTGTPNSNPATSTPNSNPVSASATVNPVSTNQTNAVFGGSVAGLAVSGGTVSAWLTPPGFAALTINLPSYSVGLPNYSTSLPNYSLTVNSTSTNVPVSLLQPMIATLRAVKL
jgi:microcystin-dependent protein